MNKDKLCDLWPEGLQGGIPHRRRETHSKHKTPSYLARTHIKVPFSALPCFGGRGPTGSSSSKTTPLGFVHSPPFVAFCHLFCLELVNFSIAVRTSSSWWAGGRLKASILSGDKKVKRARFWQHLEPFHSNVAKQPCFCLGSNEISQQEGCATVL